jgi:hypothetical protein
MVREMNLIYLDSVEDVDGLVDRDVVQGDHPEIKQKSYLHYRTNGGQQRFITPFAGAILRNTRISDDVTIADGVLRFNKSEFNSAVIEDRDRSFIAEKAILEEMGLWQ